jgi:hypothetical protein
LQKLNTSSIEQVMTLIEYIDKNVPLWKQLCFEGNGYGCLEKATQIKPEEYLRHSELDLLDKSDHGLINSLGNSKRAIDCQIDNILDAFGLKKKLHFPQKIETLEKLGVIAPRILQKTIRIRNRLEHEYYRPTRDEVENALDIAQLFIEATSKIFINFMTEFRIFDETTLRYKNPKDHVNHILNKRNEAYYPYTDSIYLYFCEKEKKFEIELVESGVKVETLTLTSGPEIYLQIISFCIRNNHFISSVEEEESIAESFVSLFRSGSASSL